MVTFEAVDCEGQSLERAFLRDIFGVLEESYQRFFFLRLNGEML